MIRSDQFVSSLITVLQTQELNYLRAQRCAAQRTQQSAQQLQGLSMNHFF
eukprot:m.51877 g.51877  ORF g.51877 m.51877 type:complete len:50 (+) comp6334_c0_seq2:134-283(+)